MSFCSKAFATAIALSLMAPPLWAAPVVFGEWVENFVTCQARYRAQEDYNRQMGRDVGRAHARAILFGDLVAAALPPVLTDQQQRALRRTRSGAQGAHWTLLQAADFAEDARLARHARSTAHRNLRMCEMLVM